MTMGDTSGGGRHRGGGRSYALADSARYPRQTPASEPDHRTRAARPSPPVGRLFRRVLDWRDRCGRYREPSEAVAERPEHVLPPRQSRYVLRLVPPEPATSLPRLRCGQMDRHQCHGDDRGLAEVQATCLAGVGSGAMAGERRRNSSGLAGAELGKYREFIDRACADAWTCLNRGEPHFLLGRGVSRSGDQRIGGINWMDWEELIPIPGLNQLVGHTPAQSVRHKKTPTSRNICLDTHLRHYAVFD